MRTLRAKEINMATWIAHLRIADNLINRIEIQNRILFIVGNIGPDCGVPNEDWSKFDPPTEISHWRNDNTREIDHDLFFTEYCENKTNDFYLGYYVHLLTDDLWRQLVYKIKKSDYKIEISKDPNFIWTMKNDWYDLDKKYLNENILNSYDLFKGIKEFPNNYFEFYPKNAFIRQIEYISNFYESRDKYLDRDFTYLTEFEMNDFVDKATKLIQKQILSKYKIIA
jgi:hypothetical protein